MTRLSILLLLFALALSAADNAPAAREMTMEETIDYHGERCLNKSAEDCKLLGDILSDEEDPFDLPAAFQFYERGCHLKNLHACFRLAYAYSEGRGTRQDYFKSVEIDRTNCRAGYSASCHNLGVSYENGHGVRINYTRAKELYGRACDLKYQHGCDAYARLNRLGY